MAGVNLLRTGSDAARDGERLPLFAKGNIARGVFAFGNVAQGVVAVGNVAHGVVSFGLSLSVGTVAIGINAVGGVAIGINAVGLVSLAAVNGAGLVCAAGVNGVGTFLSAGVNASPSLVAGAVLVGAALVASFVVPGSWRTRLGRSLVSLADLESGRTDEGWVRGVVGVDGDRVVVEAGGRRLLLDPAPGHESGELRQAVVDATASAGQSMLVHVTATRRPVLPAEAGYREAPGSERALCCVEMEAPPPSRWRPEAAAEVVWLFARGLRVAGFVGLVAWIARVLGVV